MKRYIKINRHVFDGDRMSRTKERERERASALGALISFGYYLSPISDKRAWWWPSKQNSRIVLIIN